MVKNIVNGDILTSNSKYIAHQINTIAKSCGGLAYQIFSKYPEANIYKFTDYREIGMCYKDICNDGTTIYHLVGQINLGLPNNDSLDSYKNRLIFFKNAIVQMELDFSDYDKCLADIAVPFKIGCGLGGGNWEDYYKILDESGLNITLFNFNK